MNPNKALWEKGDFTDLRRPCEIVARLWSHGLASPAA